MPALLRAGQAVQFAAVEHIIHIEARAFYTRFRSIDVDDLVGEGHLLFMVCHAEYEETAGAKFGVWFRQRLRWRYFDLLKVARRGVRGRSVQADLDAISVTIEWPDLDPKPTATGDAAVVINRLSKLKLSGRETPSQVAAKLRKDIRKTLGTRRRAEKAWAAAESFIQQGGVA